jgi:hypothetical protein
MRVLIISPHFPPCNAADMHRVRLLLPYLLQQGIQASVLAVEAGQVAAPMDPWLAASLPQDVPIHRVKALRLCWAKIPGLGLLSPRSILALRSKGNVLLREGKFDLVYFSTTVFGVHILGPEWKKKFEVPFIMDYQDPWVSDYYREHPEVMPPGGWLKYGISSWLSRRQEPRVLRHCSGLTSVSAAYPLQLQIRYHWSKVVCQKQQFAKHKAGATSFFKGIGHGPSALEIAGAARPPGGGNSTNSVPSGIRNQGKRTFPPATVSHGLPSLVIPFPGDRRDMDRVNIDGTPQQVFDPNDGCIHWVYIGVCPPPMDFTLATYFLALGHWLSEHEEIRKSLRIHFVGTSYAKAGTGKSNVMKLARAAGVADVVDEQTDRIPYSQTLRCLLDAEALIVLGTDDPGYTASKIYPYLLAEKPLLTVFHEESSVVNLIREVGGAVVVPFSTGEPVKAVAERIRREWLENERYRNPVPLDKDAFEPYTARTQAGQLAAFFRRCLEK